MKGQLLVKQETPESDQEDSFQHSSTSYNHDASLAVAIAITPVFANTDDQDEIVRKFREDVQPLLDKGWNFEVQIGKADLSQ